MPAQAPVMSKRIGDYQYERYDLSGGDSSPRRKEGPALQQQGGEKRDTKPSQNRRRPQAGQGSDTDSGIYHVRSHTLLQRRQPPPRYNRPARDTYFDKVLNNSEASSEEGSENESSYICDDCKMDSAKPYLCRNCRMNPVGQWKQPRWPKQERNNDYEYLAGRPRMWRRAEYCDHRWDDDESVSEDGAAPPPPARRAVPKPLEKPRRQSGPPRSRAPRPQKPDRLDYSYDSEDEYRPQNNKPRKPKAGTPRENIGNVNRREPPHNRREHEYSDLQGDEDDYNSEPSAEVPPRRRSGPRGKDYNRKPSHSEGPPRRSKQQVVERKTTTRPSRQNNEDDVKIRRKPITDDFSSESWSEPSEHSENSEETYEHVERTRRPSRRPPRKEHFQYEDDEPQRHQYRPHRPQKGKPQGPPPGATVGRRMVNNNDPKIRSTGARTSNSPLSALFLLNANASFHLSHTNVDQHPPPPYTHTRTHTHTHTIRLTNPPIFLKSPLFFKR
ncbi:hypothetical protein ECG_02713 [Echinococcus granulosus]|uniref:Expressed conserved protein n=1 Tax=Echinococcus granulosus TaxID=6210 RepID=A0A068WVQ5_ECHGR|nr:hypothetical protein ECG_02713 [Echinococcus granulosus]CDS21710.1 expressed conserved protein [Echinococcus granulosus]